MALSPKTVSHGSTVFDVRQGGSSKSHALDAAVIGTYPIQTDLATGVVAGGTVTSPSRAVVGGTDLIVEVLASHRCTVTIQDSPDGSTWTDRFTIPVAGGRLLTGFRGTLSGVANYRLRVDAPAGSDGGVSKVDAFSQQRPA